MTMQVECVCGSSKPHGQMAVLYLGIEVPKENNDENYIESDDFHQSIPICRKCLRRIVGDRIADAKSNKRDCYAEEIFLDLLRKRVNPIDIHDDDATEITKAAAEIAYDLLSPSSKYREEGASQNAE